MSSFFRVPFQTIKVSSSTPRPSENQGGLPRKPRRRTREAAIASSTPPPGNGSGTYVSLEELLELRLHAAGLNQHSRRKVMTTLSGAYLSAFRGRGIDFAEARHYQPGDDIRAIDWRVTARSGKPHTKLFQEERERPVLLVVDFSASMRFATRTAFKSVIAARTAALLAWAAVARGDRVGGLIFDGGRHHEIRPSGGRRGTLRFLNLLARISQEPAQQGSAETFNRMLLRTQRITRPGSLIWLLSDFYNLDEEGKNRIQRLAGHNDVPACFIYDKIEAEPPPPGFYSVSDGTRKLLFNSADKQSNQAWRQNFSQHTQDLQQFFQSKGLRLLHLATDDSIIETLRAGI